MLTFWIVAVVLIGIALTFVVPPFLRKNPPITENAANNRNLNIAIYQERQAELARDNLTPEQFAQAEEELAKLLLEELPNSTQHPQSMRGFWGGMIIIICFPVFAITGYLLSGEPQLLESKGVKEWQMLARAYTQREQLPEAIRAYQQALALEDQNPELLTDFAETLARSQGGQLTGQAKSLLETALRIDPSYPKALFLGGFAAIQAHEYQTALDYWEHLLVQIPPDKPEMRDILKKQIAKVQAAMRESKITTQPVLADATATPTTAMIQPVMTDIAATPTTASVAVQASITIQVNVAPSLQVQIKPTDSVFIYARAVQGSPMPLAIVKKTAQELPLTVTLDDSMAMLPTMKLSHFAEVIILARISSTGSAMPNSGDLEGRSEIITPGKQDKVIITINQKVP